MAAWGPGGRGGMHTVGVNAGLPGGTFYSQGSAGSAAGEHDLQLTEHQVPVLETAEKSV